MPFLKLITKPQHICNQPDPGRRGCQKVIPGTKWYCPICLQKYTLTLDSKSNPFWEKTR